MSNVISNTPCVVQFSVPESEGVVLTLALKIYDEEGTIVRDLAAVAADPDQTTIAVTVAGVDNAVSVGETHGARRAVAEFIFDNGDQIFVSQTYLIERLEKLVVAGNSFLTYEQALIMAEQAPSIPAWASATEAKRVACLREAYERICAMPMRVVPRDLETGELLEIEASVIDRDMWLEIGPDDFLSFPTHFRRALRRAQFIEASNIAQGETVLAKQRAGVLSETIGESSITLAGGRLNIGLSSAAVDALAGYLYFNNKITRV